MRQAIALTSILFVYIGCGDEGSDSKDEDEPTQQTTGAPTAGHEPAARLELGACAVPSQPFRSGPRPRAWVKGLGTGADLPPSGDMRLTLADDELGPAKAGLPGRPTHPATRPGPGVAKPTKPIRVTAERPAIKGDMDAQIVRRFLRRQLTRVKTCYAKALERNDQLSGRVELHFTIDASGRVKDASTDGFDDTMDACLTKLVRAIHFPKPRAAAVRVSYPLVFAPKEGTKNTTDRDSGAAELVDALEGASPLEPAAAALRACVGDATGVGRFVLTSGDGGAVEDVRVDGISGDVAACMKKAAAKAKLPDGHAGSAVACPVAFGTLAPAEAFGIDIDGTLGDGTLAGKLATHDQTGPVVIRAAADTQARALFNVLAAVIRSGHSPLLAARDGGAWRTIPETALPVVPVPEGTGRSWTGVSRDAKPPPAVEPKDAPVLLAILVTDGRIWTGISKYGDVIQVRDKDGERNLAHLDKTLRGYMKQSDQLTESKRIEVSATDEVDYATLAMIIERVQALGFTEWKLIPPRMLSVTLPPQPDAKDDQPKR